MGLYDSYKNDTSVQSNRRDFPTCRVFAINDGFFEKVTYETEKPYLQSHWTIVAVLDDGEGGVSKGDQHTISFFPSKKYRFFERETKMCAGRLRGITSLKAIDKLETADVKAVFHGTKKKPAEGPGVVLELKCKRHEEDEENEKSAFTRVDFIRRVGAEELTQALSKKDLKLFFPNGMDEEGRAIGHALHEEDESEDEEDEKPRKKGKSKPRDEEDEEEDEEEEDEEEEDEEEEEEDEEEEDEDEEEEDEEEEEAPKKSKFKGHVKVKGKK